MKRIYQSILAALALQLAAFHTLAGPMPVADVGLGVLPPGITSGSAALRNKEPLWFQFTVATASRVGLNTFGSEVVDTELALYDPLGVLLGQNDDCLIPSFSFQSCLLFPVLQPATYLAAAGAWNFNLDFLDMWEFSGVPGDGTQSITLNVSIEAIASPVPNPATLLLMGLGLAGLGLSRRKNV